eukprot:TRINITY_DN772_c0_g1_i1.p1 TRINITY_DN772_c0_g1~~TRINITY_DN772_c0_g1_i1.p1  ORF type:complete len:235 (-),score=17.90 TRINITY_DN772_c0_g1_i1:773-1477(-)
MASVAAASDSQTKNCDPYRYYMSEDTEKETLWRHGEAPSYDAVNELFQAERTKVWEKGSVEETIQNLVKTWEMELSHKVRFQDMKTLDPERFSVSVNGRPPQKLQDIIEKGGYNVFLESDLEEIKKCYDASKETADSSHEIFKRVFPGGFAWEVLKVYSPPPRACFKFRHWGRMAGPFKSHPPSHRTVHLTGVATALVIASSSFVHSSFLVALLCSSYCCLTVSAMDLLMFSLR